MAHRQKPTTPGAMPASHAPTPPPSRPTARGRSRPWRPVPPRRRRGGTGRRSHPLRRSASSTRREGPAAPRAGAGSRGTRAERQLSVRRGPGVAGSAAAWKCPKRTRCPACQAAGLLVRRRSAKYSRISGWASRGRLPHGPAPPRGRGGRSGGARTVRFQAAGAGRPQSKSVRSGMGAADARGRVDRRVLNGPVRKGSRPATPAARVCLDTTPRPRTLHEATELTGLKAADSFNSTDLLRQRPEGRTPHLTSPPRRSRRKAPRASGPERAARTPRDASFRLFPSAPWTLLRPP